MRNLLTKLQALLFFNCSLLALLIGMACSKHPAIESMFVHQDTLCVRLGKGIVVIDPCAAQQYLAHLVIVPRLEYAVKFSGNVPK